MADLNYPDPGVEEDISINAWGAGFTTENDLTITNSTKENPISLSDINKWHQIIIKPTTDQHYDHHFPPDYNLKLFGSKAICPHAQALTEHPTRADWMWKTPGSMKMPYTSALYEHCQAVDNQIFALAEKAYPNSAQQQQWLIKVLSKGKTYLQEVQLAGVAQTYETRYLLNSNEGEDSLLSTDGRLIIPKGELLMDIHIRLRNSIFNKNFYDDSIKLNISHPFPELQGMNPLSPIGDTLTRGPLWFAIFIIQMKQGTTGESRRLEPMWNKVPPTFDPTSREYNAGYTLSLTQWQVLTQQLYQALLKFTDLSDTTSNTLSCRTQVEALNYNYLCQNRFWAGERTIKHPYSKPDTYTLIEAKSYFMRIFYEKGYWANDFLELLLTFQRACARKGYSITDQELFEKFINDFVIYHAATPGDDAYGIALQQLAEAYASGKPSNFRGTPKHYAQAFASFQALHSFLNGLYAKFQHRLFRKPPPLKWKQLLESIENTHKSPSISHSALLLESSVPPAPNHGSSLLTLSQGARPNRVGDQRGNYYKKNQQQATRQNQATRYYNPTAKNYTGPQAPKDGYNGRYPSSNRRPDSLEARLNDFQRGSQNIQKEFPYGSASRTNPPDGRWAGRLPLRKDAESRNKKTTTQLIQEARSQIMHQLSLAQSADPDQCKNLIRNAMQNLQVLSLEEETPSAMPEEQPTIHQHDEADTNIVDSDKIAEDILADYSGIASHEDIIQSLIDKLNAPAAIPDMSSFTFSAGMHPFFSKSTKTSLKLATESPKPLSATLDCGASADLTSDKSKFLPGTLTKIPGGSLKIQQGVGCMQIDTFGIIARFLSSPDTNIVYVMYTIGLLAGFETPLDILSTDSCNKLGLTVILGGFQGQKCLRNMKNGNQRVDLKLNQLPNNIFQLPDLGRNGITGYNAINICDGQPFDHRLQLATVFSAWDPSLTQALPLHIRSQLPTAYLQEYLQRLGHLNTLSTDPSSSSPYAAVKRAQDDFQLGMNRRFLAQHIENGYTASEITNPKYPELPIASYFITMDDKASDDAHAAMDECMEACGPTLISHFHGTDQDMKWTHPGLQNGIQNWKALINYKLVCMGRNPELDPLSGTSSDTEVDNTAPSGPHVSPQAPRDQHNSIMYARGLPTHKLYTLFERFDNERRFDEMDNLLADSVVGPRLKTRAQCIKDVFPMNHPDFQEGSL